MNGYTGKILFVNLTTREITTQELNREYAAQFIGGSGLAARYIFDWIDANTDPLGPENPLVFMNGPLDGAGAPVSGRFAVCARSPQTGLWGEAIAGNFFGPELKFAGYDGIVIRGRAEKLSYLHITPDGAELRDAEQLRGMTTFDAGDALRAENNDSGLVTACIGPAGEKLVKYALILTSSARAGAKKGIAGRCGMGAVMGSKNLKAVAVRGSKHHRTHKLHLYDTARLRAAATNAQKFLADDMATEVLRAVGSSGSMDYYGLLGDVPTKYWTQGTFNYENISGNLMAETILAGRNTCHACMVACGRKVERAGEYEIPHGEGPEFETMAGFGPLILSDDLNLAVYIGSQCDALGLDSISASSTIAFAYYLRSLDLLPREVVGETDLVWGDAHTALRLVQEIARREGFGAVLAEGSRALGAQYGVEGLAVQISNMELAMHDPRAAMGMAITYATSPIGGSHNQSDYFFVETSGRPIEELGIETMDRFASAGKALSIARHQNWRTVNNASVTCYFPNPPVEEVCAMLSAATGYDITTDNVLTFGERIWNLKRLLNLKLGYKARRAEQLPELILRPLSEGGTEGNVPDFELMLREYYQVRDWDWDTGKPSRAKLEALGLWQLARDWWSEI
jgi:aldehyde:ferredoxin oxidoreductase